ncbi:MAG: hypothetical protein P4M12_05795 [Gammaproteobacteria bacterium]|nr:hypothetical protein [Gammaproteobacteria bacterium]
MLKLAELVSDTDILMEVLASDIDIPGYITLFLITFITSFVQVRFISIARFFYL